MGMIETTTRLSKKWLVRYQPRWWQWRLKKKALWVFQEIYIPEYKGYSVGIKKANEECNHRAGDGLADYYGTSIPAHDDDWDYAYCPKCGEKL
jgi:hypothetical protein